MPPTRVADRGLARHRRGFAAPEANPVLPWIFGWEWWDWARTILLLPLSLLAEKHNSVQISAHGAASA